jgi:hypothetical protein
MQICSYAQAFRIPADRLIEAAETGSGFSSINENSLEKMLITGRFFRRNIVQILT